MLVNRTGEYLLEAMRYTDPTTDLFYAWFNCGGRILGFASGSTMADACCDALNEWMNGGGEKDEPTLDAWHFFRSAFLVPCPVGWDHT